MKIYAIDRKKVIKDYYDISELEGAPCGTHFAYTTSRYQYFIAQLVAVSHFNEEIDIVTSPLVGEGQELSNAVSCINSYGTDAEGMLLFRKVKLFAGMMQPLFIGFDLSKAKLGAFTTTITIGGIKVKLTLNLNDDLVFNEGSDDVYSGGRLKWLNSALGAQDIPLSGYNPMVLDGSKLLFTGKEAVVGNDGLIEDMISYFSPSNYLSDTPQNNLFYKPMEFLVDGQRYRYSKQRVSGKGVSVSYSADGRADATRIEVAATAKYEGYIDYQVKVIAEKDTIINNISLNFYFSACTYNMGLGKKGGYFQPLDYKWDNGKQQDSIFIGDTNCGARVQFKDAQDTVAFEGEYYRFKPFKLPMASWANRGKGSISLIKTDKGAMLSASTGRIILAAGKSCRFDFELHFTPFKQTDLQKQFANRSIAYKSGDIAGNLERASWYGSNVLQLGWCSPVYKYINYPFLNIGDLKDAVLAAKTKGFKSTIDYSLWHTSANNPELNMLRAFGREFIFRTQTPLAVSFDQRLYNAVPAATAANAKGQEDVSVLLESGSRLDNYFVEAINYLYGSLRVDGINIQGTHISRSIAERIQRVTQGCKAAVGITLQESDNFTPQRAEASSLNLHTHLLPFIDRLSVDASFAANASEDYTLCEVSGMLYGVGAEASSALYNPLELLLYGITVQGGLSREKGEVYKESLYKVIKDFGIGDSRMYGYWDANNPVSTDKKEVKLTTYINGGALIAVVFNQGKKGLEFDIGINPKLGYTSKDKQITKPLIVGLQSPKVINFNKSFYLQAGKGMLLLIK